MNIYSYLIYEYDTCIHIPTPTPIPIPIHIHIHMGFPGGMVVKNLPASAGDVKRLRFNSWVRKILWRRAWQPLQYSCLENPMDRGAWQATVHRVAKSWTQLEKLNTHTHTYIHTFIYIYIYIVCNLYVCIY